MKGTLIVMGSFLLGLLLPEVLAAFAKVRVPAGMNWVCGIGLAMLMAGLFVVT